jgi:uncharacterized protein (TIGR02246 family)
MHASAESAHEEARAMLFDQIKSTFERFAAAWSTHDGAALAATFTEDGSLINPFGERADGRGALAGMYAGYFAGMLGGTSTSFELKQVRAVGDDHVFADAAQTVYAADGSLLLALHLSALLRRQAQRWSFVDSRPYAFSTPPA